MNTITKYFKSVLTSQKHPAIDFKKEKYVIERNLSNVENGKLTLSITEELFQGQKTTGTLNVIIALRTVSTLFENAAYKEWNRDELTCVLFLPAKLDKFGNLSMPSSGKLPWIPLDYLSPKIEDAISIGTVDDYDNFLSKITGERNRIKTWDNHFEYAKKMYKYVTKTSFYQNTIPRQNQNLELENQYYIFEDKSVFAAQQIMNLYTYLQTHSENALYRTITSNKVAPTKPHPNEFNLQKMKEHLGQMGGEYPLSPSQREAIHTFTELKEGEVLAVSGPPGTGKTTLLQSIVANMLVQHALEEKKPPIIVASSTNNQAVTNIISSFEKITPIGIENFEQRWICGVTNFATYFPSDQKKNEAKENGYQYTNNKGENFFYQIEDEENRKKSKKLFCQEYRNFFHVNISENTNTIFEKLKCSLSSELKRVDSIRNQCLNKIAKLKRDISNPSFNTYILEKNKEIQSKKENITKLQEEISKLSELNNFYHNRIQEWKDFYSKLPRYRKVFSFLPSMKQKFISSYDAFMSEEEASFLHHGMTVEEIEQIYLTKKNENTLLIETVKPTLSNIEKELKILEDSKIDNQRKHQDILKSLKELNTYNIFSNERDYQLFDELELEKINDVFDTKIRYVEFWLAVHYYECMWLAKDLSFTDKQKGKTFRNILEELFERIAMVSPCMVMTFFMVPKNFLTYEKDYMINYIDLLIVDEAGQISPEIAAASFSLAKKAVVVGDEKQIPPVWGTEKMFDIRMAIDNDVIQNPSDFTFLQNTGLNCSESSIMRIAANSCFYEKYEKGLFLSEHRRCYDEIIEYCNNLVYNGKLEPMRGSFQNENNPLKGYLPPMGHKEITVSRSKSMGLSRCNELEAEQIALWIQDNYPILLQKYPNNSPNEILGIITPFKAQSNLIKKKLAKHLSNYKNPIPVGTVHSFQGAEYKVIIFSSVYGNQDGCFFINQNASLMNVAVSRAKDSFLVFGDSGCLVGGSEKDAGPMLKKATAQSI